MRISRTFSSLLLCSMILAVLGCVTAPPPTAVQKPSPTPEPTATVAVAPTPLPAPTEPPVPVATTAPAGTPTQALVPTATPLPTPQPDEAIASLEWVRDGVVLSEPHLVELLETASATSQSYFRRLMDTPWVKEKQGIHFWEDAVGALNGLAAVDESAALRVLELELSETIGHSHTASTEFLHALGVSDRYGLNQLLSHPSLVREERDSQRFIPLLYLGSQDSEAASAVESLPWVRDGLKYLEYSLVAELTWLAEQSRPVFDAALGAVMDWQLRDSRDVEYPEALRLVRSIAVADEEAALQVMDLPILEPSEAPNIHALRSLAALAESDPPQLAEVLAHPAVTAGDETLASIAILILGLRHRDTEAATALEGLLWVQEGIGKYLADATSMGAVAFHQEAGDVFELLLLLEHDPPNGRTLFLTIASKDWMQDGMIEHELNVVSDLRSGAGEKRELAQRIVQSQTLDAISELAWTKPGALNYNASEARPLVELGSLEDDRVFKAVLERPWVQDDIGVFEEALFESLVDSFGKGGTAPRLWPIEFNGDYEFGMFIISLYLEEHDPEALAALESLPWIKDGIDSAINTTRLGKEEFNDIVRLFHLWERWTIPVAGTDGQRSESTTLFLDLLNKSWVRDGIEDHERQVVQFLQDLLRSAAQRLIPMPFLDTVEQSEAETLDSLRRQVIYDQSGLVRLLDQPEYADGLTDDNFADAMALLRELLS